MMSKMQRDKGRRGELEVAALLNEYGFNAELIRGQEEIGGGAGDFKSDLGNGEVKRRGALPKWASLRSDEIQHVWMREDRGRWMVLVDGRGYLVDQKHLTAALTELRRLRHVVQVTAAHHAHLRRQHDEQEPRSCKAAPCTCELCVLAREMGLVSEGR